ncbi:DNA directed RNA polymerase II 15 kDa subunit [Penicillium sp. IBT 18751x]|nr:DNA directed RNA polymerase II 15 kDa subunit [Penicillium sp. IBT 18751x]
MSASPSPSAGGDTKQSDQIHFRFCRECSNLLYPKEDRHTNQLMFTCRTCHVGEPATSYCVYQNKLNSQVGATAGVTQDVSSDPTVCDPEFLHDLDSFPGFCLCCGHEIACWVCGVLPFTSSMASSVAHVHHSEDDDTPKTAPFSQSNSFLV